jgi:eukaryotic-like serine/threonine-protein kinase
LPPPFSDASRVLRAPEGGGGGGLPLGEHVMVDLAAPLAAFDRPGAKAYGAIDKRFPDGQHVAYVCEPDRSVRIRSAQKLRGISRSGMLSILETGVLQRPGQPDAYVVVMEKPVGPPPPRKMWSGWSPKTLVQNFLRPVTLVLKDMSDRDEIHGSIRPDNVFAQDSKAQLLTLGPCVLGPVGYDQPPEFEPVERALATPDGKGPGAPLDDMFALGMTLYCFATGKYPGEGQHADALMARRIAYGTVSTMIDTSQIPSELFDPITALIDDDLKMRWTLATLTEWVNGRRPTLQPRKQVARRGTPLKIGPVAALEPPELAFALHHYPKEGQAAVGSDAVGSWLKDNDVQRVLTLLGEDKAQSQNAAAEVQVARYVVRLDPKGPLRFKDLAFHPGGAGPVAHSCMLDPKKRAQLEEFFSWRIAHIWAKAATPFGLIDEAARKLLEVEDRISNNVDKLEAALYRLNPDAPCLSPAVQGKWVDQAGDLLEFVEESIGRGQLEFDAHVVSFLGARSGISAADLGAIKSFDGKDPRRAAAVLKAAMRFAMDAKGRKLPHLARLCHDAAKALIGRLKKPELRESKLRDAEALAAAGDIPALVDLATDPDVFGRDLAEFAEIKKEFDTNQRVLDNRDAIVEATRSIGREKGREIALAILSGVSIVVLLTQLYFQVMAR